MSRTTTDSRPSRLSAFLEEVEAPERTLVVLNRTGPAAIGRLLDRAFGGQPVTVEERDLPGGVTDTVLLFEGGEPVAASPLSSLKDTLLLVNSDLYRTGARELDEVDPPAALVELDDTVFRLEGFPDSNKEKLILIVVSRYIERLAWDAGGGRLRSAFQRLSRIDDERGTRSVYEQLGDSGVDVHVYGVPDWTPPEGAGLAVHGGTDERYRRSWFVVHVPPGVDTSDPAGVPDTDDVDGQYAALVAIENGDNEWDGMWTHRPERVARIDRFVDRAF